jgi:hypothetical protein
MIDPFSQEQYEADVKKAHAEALEYAGENGGAYLDYINKTDLAKLSPDEWNTFLEEIISNWKEKFNELAPCPF